MMTHLQRENGSHTPLSTDYVNKDPRTAVSALSGIPDEAKEEEGRKIVRNPLIYNDYKVIIHYIKANTRGASEALVSYEKYFSFTCTEIYGYQDAAPPQNLVYL